jgi:two-component system NarL family sensor kinase
MPEDVAPRPDDLANALRALAARLSPRGLPIDCRLPALDAALPPAVAAASNRICEEALGNAVRHAHARRIAIELHARDARLLVRVFDDGIGFDMAALHGDGILRMNELALSAGGRLDLRSAPHAGTCVSAMFSLVK